VTPAEIIKEIQTLSIESRWTIIEQTLLSIKEAGSQNQLQEAAEALYQDYRTDKELTAFTDLDLEGFYEAR
jgi:hypothetical protein